MTATMTDKTRIMMEEVFFLHEMGQPVEHICAALGRTPHSIVKAFEYYGIKFSGITKFRAYAKELKKRKDAVNV